MNSQEAYENYQGVEVTLPKKQGKGIICGYDNENVIIALTIAPENHDGWSEDEMQGSGVQIMSNNANELGYWFVGVSVIQEAINGN